MLKRFIALTILSVSLLGATEKSGDDTGSVLLDQTGYVSYYTENPTVGTIAYRLEAGDVTLEDLLWADAVIATQDCRWIGHRAEVWITKNGKMSSRPIKAIVFDCARRDDGDGTRSWMEDNNIIFEVDWYNAVSYGIPDRTSAVRGRIRILTQ